MLLIDVGKLVLVKATSADTMTIIRKDFPNGLQVIQGPIKVKLETDVLIVISPAQDANGNLMLRAEVLKSTARKFQSSYVHNILKGKLISSGNGAMQFAELKEAVN